MSRFSSRITNYGDLYKTVGLDSTHTFAMFATIHAPHKYIYKPTMDLICSHFSNLCTLVNCPISYNRHNYFPKGSAALLHTSRVLVERMLTTDQVLSPEVNLIGSNMVPYLPKSTYHNVWVCKFNGIIGRSKIFTLILQELVNGSVIIIFDAIILLTCSRARNTCLV